MYAMLAKASGIPPRGRQVLLRWLGLLVLLAGECLVLTWHFQAPTVADDASWPAWVFAHTKEFWRIGLGCPLMVLLIVRARWQAILGTLRAQAHSYYWGWWLVCHFLAYGGLVWVTAHVFALPTDPTRLSVVWLVGWSALLGATLVLWLLAVAPWRVWVQLAAQERTGLLMGVLLGLPVGVLLLGKDALWTSLATPTLWLVYVLLQMVYADLVYAPEQFLVGTPHFHVEISPPCSGYEGMIVLTVFLILYLSLFHQEVRWPHALGLFPIGLLAIYVSNAVRIAALIVIGASFSPAVAVGGFHSYAGWLAFAMIALGLIALSRRMRLFTPASADAAVTQDTPPLAAALLVPLLVLLAGRIFAAAFSSGFRALYPLGIVGGVAALWYYRRTYQGLGWIGSWPAAGMGGAVFLLWLLLAPSTESSQTAIAHGLAAQPVWWAAVWVTMRVLGSVLVVPLAEELAFRGYLLRKLSASQFETVPLNQCTWTACLVSSVLFGLLHERWVAGTLAGLAYAWACNRRGQLGEAVLAHMTTNALLAAYVLVQGRWALWA